MTKIKNFFKSNTRIAVLILFILEFCISIWITPDKYDSEFFINQVKEMSVLNFVKMRYQTWTSRILIETLIGVILLKSRFVWVILNTLMMTILGYSILKLFVKNDDKSLVWMTICFILLYPLNKIASCDWGAGSMNYTWPLAMLLFSAISIKKICNEEKIAKYQYPLYSLALIFACNQEQSCAIALGAYFVFTFLYILKHKKVHPFFIIQCILILLSLAFVATCPGNYARKSNEISTYYADFASFSMLDKISLGLTATVNQLLLNTNVVFLVFSLVTTVYIFKQYKNNLYRAISLVPFVACLAFGVLKDIVCKMYPYFGIFCEILMKEDTMLNAENYLNFINFLPLVLAFVILGSMLLNILLIFKNLKSNVAIVIFLLGVMSRMALGFSPTVFASTDRTFLFFEFALIIISVLIWQEFMKETDKSQIKTRSRLATFIAVLAVLQYVHTIIYTFISQV